MGVAAGAMPILHILEAVPRHLSRTAVANRQMIGSEKDRRVLRGAVQVQVVIVAGSCTMA